MQTLINLLSLASFVVSASVVGGGVYLYSNKDALIEDAKQNVIKAATEAVTGALPGMMNSSMPKMPSATGGVIPSTPKNDKMPGPSLPF
jgi:hypothetical protein